MRIDVDGGVAVVCQLPNALAVQCRGFSILVAHTNLDIEVAESKIKNLIFRSVHIVLILPVKTQTETAQLPAASSLNSGGK